MTDIEDVIARAINDTNSYISREYSIAMLAPAVIAALEAAGMAVVPIEPTDKMCAEALDADLDIYWGYRADGPGDPEDVYRVMISAAPGRKP